MGVAESVIQFIGSQAPLLIYLSVALGAAIENVFPPIPADTFVLFGAFLASQGRAEPWLVFAATWGGNVLTALMTYGLARRYGRAIFRTRIGHMVLRPGQLGQIERFYGRYGIWTIFLSRFLPGFRAVVPIFAGVSRFGFWRTALPLGIASAIWYGIVVVVGLVAGRNWRTIVDTFGQYSTALGIVGAVLVALVLWWWWRTRHHEHDAGED